MKKKAKFGIGIGIILISSLFIIIPSIFDGHIWEWKPRGIYYVSFSTGNDRNDGESPESPWKTIDQVNRWDFEAGTIILFKKGDEWNGEIILVSKGNETHPIILSAYGFGPHPIINGKKYALTLQDTEFTDVKNMDFREGTEICVVVRGSVNTTIENCFIGLDTWGYGLRITGSYSQSKSADHGIIRNCTIDSGLSGKVLISGRDGIQLTDGAKYWAIYNNSVYNWPHTGIGLSQIFELAETAYNHIYQNYIYGGDIDYMRGLETFGREGYVHHNEFYRNYIKDTTITNHVEGNNNSYYYNIIDTVRNPNDRTDAHGFDFTAFASGLTEDKHQACHDNRLFNNVIYNTASEGIILIGSVKDNVLQVENNLIINNLLLETNGGIRIHNREMGGNVFKHNLVYNSHGWDNYIYKDLAVSALEFNNLNGDSGNSIVNNLNANPLLFNPISGDFRLTTNSPCIDAGLDVGLLFDFFNSSVPVGIAPDIGAIEWL